MSYYPEGYQFENSECRQLANILWHYAVSLPSQGAKPDGEGGAEVYGAIQQIDGLVARLSKRIDALEGRTKSDNSPIVAKAAVPVGSCQERGIAADTHTQEMRAEMALEAFIENDSDIDFDADDYF